MPDEDDAPETPEPPPAPFTPEDGAYQMVVSEYVGLQRAGASPVSAALITAAHLLYIGLANAAQDPEC